MENLKKKSVIFLGILLLSSCGSTKLPKKPSINICAHLYNEQIVTCINNRTGEGFDLELNETDSFIMFDPDDYGLLLKYIRLLELRTPKMIRSELKKFRRVSKKLYGISNYRETP